MEGRIVLPHGGPAASFPVHALVAYIRNTGRDYIIQGQQQCSLAAHTKRHSLDSWLRKNYARNPDTKQAVNRVIVDLVSTGLFTVQRLICPDSGRICKGIRLVKAPGNR